MNEVLVFVQTLKGCAASENNQGPVDRGCNWCRINSCLLLLTPFTVQTAADGVLNNDKDLSSLESEFFLGQILFNCSILSEPLVNAPLTSISKKSPVSVPVELPSTRETWTLMQTYFLLALKVSVFCFVTKMRGKNNFFPRFYFFISQGRGCKE